jgi:tetratricopeptide (TPR) repeat protein
VAPPDRRQGSAIPPSVGPGLPKAQPREPPEELPLPRPGNTSPPAKGPPTAAEDDRALLLGAARNAASLRDWETALGRFEEYFRRGGDDPAVRKERAGLLAQAGRPQEALREYQSLLARAPADPDLRNACADLVIHVRDYREAVALLTPALERDPGNRELATRLARAYVFMDDYPHALMVYDKHLAQLRPGDDKLPTTFPALLVDLERPAEALTFLKGMLARQPANPELRATRVRALARLGDRSSALEALEVLATLGPASVPARLSLAETLYTSEDFEVAAAAFGQVLQAEPGNGEARVGLARVHIQQYQPRQARELLEGLAAEPTLKRRYAQARAEYHQSVGEFADAKQVYQRLLHENQNDHEVRLSVGALYEEPLREDERAKAEYSKVPPAAEEYRRAQVGVAASLTNQRHFAEAEHVCRAVLAERPSDGNAVAQLAHTLMRAGRHNEAVGLCRSFLEANSRNIPALRTVRLALGQVLHDAHHPQEAVLEFEQVLGLPGGRNPMTCYGLARAAEMEGSHDKARQILIGGTDPLHPDARYWILLADLYSADNDDHSALEMAQVVLRTEPDNLAALTRVVTAQARLARFSGCCDETVKTARAILAVSPTNIRAHLEMARALASAQRLKESIHAYEALIAVDPTARLPRLERARMLHGDHQFATAQAAYQELLNPSAEAVLHVDLDELARREPRIGHVTALHLPPDLSSQILKTELSRVGACDADATQAVSRAFLDYQARAAEQAADRLEAEAKAKDWRPRAAIPVQSALLALEPANTAVEFDLGQSYSNLCMTRRAIQTYAEELHVDPHEREAAMVLERAGLELAPQAIGTFDYFNQNGRQGLANITRMHYGTGVRVPYGDEDEYLYAGFSRADYIPRHDSPLEGNIISGGFQAKCWDRLYAFGLANVEDYADRIQPRVTFDAGMRCDFCDLLSGRAELFLYNVEENGETMRQDIYRYGTRLGADLCLSRRWSAFANYTYAHYSDDNDYNEMYLRTDYILCFPPGELKVILATDVLGYRASTMLQTGDPTNLEGVVHPYWSPRLYVYYESRLSWKQWLSRDYAAHSNQCWYCLEYALGWDNLFNSYNVVEARFNNDVKPWLSIGAHGGVILSPVYNAQWATAYVIFRWPWCH